MDIKNSLQSLDSTQRAFRSQCVAKWKPLLEAKNSEPIKNPHTRGVVAVLLENQYKSLKESASNNSSIWGQVGSYGGAISQGDTYATGDNRLPKVLLPMIRRTFPELISNEIVGVQPMSGPVSLAFAMRNRYVAGPLHEARSAGTLINPTSTESSYGVGAYRPSEKNPPGATDMRQLENTVGAPDAQGAEMGYNYLDNSFTGRRNALFNRTLNPATQAPWTDSEIINFWNLIKYPNQGGQPAPIQQVNTLGELVDIASGKTAITEPTVNPALPAGTTRAKANELLQVTSLAGGKFTFSDQDLGAAALMGDYEATGRIPRTKFTFEKRAVEAGTRRLGSSWTLELEQDIRNMQGMDIENEVTSMMSYELQAEIDREMIIRMLYSALSANEFSYWDGSKADARWMAERDRAFYQYIIQMSNRMTIRNRRGPANFIVATPDVCSLLETLPQYALMEVNGTVSTDSSGIAKIGTIGGGRFTVFRDTRTPVQNNSWINNSWDNQGQYTVNQKPRTQGIPDFCLLGYKGSEFWDAGIIYCPYIPIILQRVVDPVSFEPNVGLMTRYGVVDNLFGANLYYHVILIDTLGNTLPSAANPANHFPGTYPNASVLTDTPQQGGYSVDLV